MDVAVVVGPGIVILPVEEEVGLPQPPLHQVVQHLGPLVAPGGNGVDHLRLGVVVDPLDQVGAEPVGGVHPLGAQGIGHGNHGVKLVLGDGDAIVQQQAVDLLLRIRQVLTEEHVRLLLGDAVRVVRRIAGSAVADVPVPPVVGIGHVAVALKFLNESHPLVAGDEDLHGQGPGGQQRQHHKRAQK